MNKAKLTSIFKLLKFRLSLSVAGTAVFGYLLAIKWNGDGTIWANVNWTVFWAVAVGGSLLTFGANGLNQVIEKEQDAIMNRTTNRPVATGKLSSKSATWISWFMAILGISVLLAFSSFAAAFAGIISFITYVFFYTPLKGISPAAVLVGAIPGALPPLIGYLAHTNQLDYAGFLLFLIQFFWQFAHFWAIAWLLHDDYLKVGYWLLPTKSGRSKQSAMQIIVYSILLVITSMMPIFFVYKNFDSNTLFLQLSLVLIAGLAMVVYAIKLYITLEHKSAKQLMFCSLIHNPIIYLIYLVL